MESSCVIVIAPYDFQLVSVSELPFMGLSGLSSEYYISGVCVNGLFLLHFYAVRVRSFLLKVAEYLSESG